MAGQGPWGGGSGGDDGKGGKQPPQEGGQRPWGNAGGNNQGGRDDRPQGPRRGEQIPEIEELVTMRRPTRRIGDERPDKSAASA